MNKDKLEPFQVARYPVGVFYEVATKALAQEIGRQGITVNAIAPGFIKTDMTADLYEKELKALIPVKRFGLPEEVAHAAAFLASPEASYITAQVISVNGGLYS